MNKQSQDVQLPAARRTTSATEHIIGHAVMLSKHKELSYIALAWLARYFDCFVEGVMLPQVSPQQVN